jgi:pyruvate ferredoxin oxidoreductase alpha subunit
VADQLELLTFLDLDWGVVNRVLEREKQQRRSGPVAEGILRDMGTASPSPATTLAPTPITR